MSDTVIPADSFRRFATQILQRLGMPEPHANDVADVLTWTSLRGVDTHGVRNLKRYYVDWINDGTLNPNAQFRSEFETPVSARTDGDMGVGIAAACWAMRLAMKKAAESGMGLVAMRNTHHLGAAGYYPHMAIERDMIGACMTGYLFAEGNETGVLPTFGSQAMFSTNPLSVAFPTRDEPEFVLDMATSVVPINRVEAMQELGQSIPLGWGLDKHGQPTTDPSLLKTLFPLGGTRETGGHKGYGLAMMVEVFSAVLSGAWCNNPNPQKILGSNPVAHNGYAQEAVAHFFAAFRIDLFRSPDEFREGMDAMIRALHDAPKEEGQDRIYVAGEMEHETTQQRLKSGIPIPAHVADDLRELSKTYDVPLDGLG